MVAGLARARTARALLVSLVGLSSCLLPSDSSGKLSIVVQGVPAMFFVGDSIVIRASLRDASGAEIPSAELWFATDNPSALEIRPFSGQGAEFLGRLAEPAVVTVGALAYDLAPVSFNLSIARGISVDSVRPLQARWGDTLVAYGAGLDPAELIHFHVGGVPSHPVSYEGLEPRPDRYGRVTLIVPAGAPPMSMTEALTRVGQADGPELTITAQEDRYEPNDDAPADLGTLAAEFHNPGLALERRPRGDVRAPIDWYRFTNTTTQDRTILLMGAAAEETGAFISGATAVYWEGGAVYSACGGFALGSGHPVGDTVMVALKGLPAGTYEIQLFYQSRNQDRPYELMIMPEYMSMMAPDAAEGNDYCGAAQPVAIGAAARSLNIDRPNDEDWFKFSVGAGGLNLRFLVLFADSNDLDFEILQDFLPDSILFYDFSFSGDPNREDYTVTLPQGDYLLHLWSYLSEPVDYTLSVTSVPAASVPATSAGAGGRGKVRRRGR